MDEKQIDFSKYIDRTEIKMLTGKSLSTISELMRDLYTASGDYLEIEEATRYDLTGENLVIKAIPPGKKRKSLLMLKEYAIRRYGLSSVATQQKQIYENRNINDIKEILATIEKQNNEILSLLKK